MQAVYLYVRKYLVRTMKKVLAAMMVALLLTGNVGWMKVAYANEENAIEENCECNDDAINELFSQREQLILEMQNAEAEGLVTLNGSSDMEEEFGRIDDELLALGVRKIDPSKPEDMAYLRELPSHVENEDMRTNGIYDDAPDLSIIATSYDLYISDGTITPNDGTEAGEKSYSYRAVRVTDKVKGSTEQLYQRRKVKMLTAEEVVKNQIKAILEFNFEVLLDKFYGKFVGKPLLKWALENLDAFLNASSVCADVGVDEGYTTAYSSTTTMNYYYLYNPIYGWKLIASCATASATRVDRFVGEINARPFDKDVYTEQFTMKSGSGRTLKQYVTAYVSVMDTRPDYFVSAWFGNLQLKTYSKEKVEYQPKYADTPFDLMTLPNGATY